MNCPNCGVAVSDNANFCQNCGFRFDEIRQVEPIRVVIGSPAPPEIVPPVPPQVIVRETKSGSTGAIVVLTIMVSLLFVGAAGLFVYYLINRSSAVETSAANANSRGANQVIAAVPSPTTYEDLKNKLAPPDKRKSLMDEQFEIAATAPRSIEFTIDDAAGARLVGGFRVTKGKTVNFRVYPADVDVESLTTGYKLPVNETKTRNKILNQRLTPDNYVLVFENNDELPVTVAAELFLVFD